MREDAAIEPRIYANATSVQRPGCNIHTAFGGVEIDRTQSIRCRVFADGTRSCAEEHESEPMANVSISQVCTACQASMERGGKSNLVGKLSNGGVVIRQELQRRQGMLLSQLSIF